MLRGVNGYYFNLAAAHLQLNRLKLGTMIQRTEVGFTSFSTGGFTIATFVNQVDKKLVDLTSVL